MCRFIAYNAFFRFPHYTQFYWCRLTLTLAACFAVGCKSLADEWPQFRGPMRDAKSSESGLLHFEDNSKLSLRWTASGAGGGYASVAVTATKLVTTGNRDGAQCVTAFNVEDGQVVWSTAITSGTPGHDYQGSRSTPTIDGEFIYAIASNGSIHCLRSADGTVIWSRPFTDWDGKLMSGWGYSESPLVDGDWVICTPGADDGVMVALDKRSGQEVWACRLVEPEGGDVDRGKELREGAGYSSVMVTQGGGVKQYITLVGRGVIGVRAHDGKLLWRYAGVANTVANIPTVIVEGDYVFCSTGYDTGSALLKLEPNGEEEIRAVEQYFLESKVLQNKHGGMVLVDGYIYCGHGNGSGMPICVELSSGKVVWGPVRGEGRGESSVAYVDAHILFRFESGEISFVKATPDGYQVAHTFMPDVQEDASWAYPVVANGRMYLREQDRIMCYDLRH